MRRLYRSTWLRFPLCAGLLAYVWLAGASALYCRLAGRWEMFRFPFLQWAEVAPWWLHEWHLTLYVIASATFPTLMFALLAAGVLSRRNNGRIRPSLFGKAQFADQSAMRRDGFHLKKKIF